MPHPLHVRDLYVAYLAARFGRNATPELYREEQWITIGGRPEGEKKHAQGTPVKVDSEGKITAGPAALRGKKVSELKSSESAPRKLRRSESLPGQQFLFAGAKPPQ